MSPRSRTESKHLRVYEVDRHRRRPNRLGASLLQSFVWALAWSICYALGLSFATWRLLFGLLLGVHLYYLGRVVHDRRNDERRH